MDRFCIVSTPSERATMIYVYNLSVFYAHADEPSPDEL